MCGIAGLVSRAGPIAGAAELADAYAAALAHRGPDGAGRWLSAAGDVLLVHRRLAIIDPGPDGAQPMTAPGGEVIVFNGEIYNYRELRADLERRGERFVSSSDTEVLLRLIALDGPSALERARGMFALAIWNPVERTLLLARDRFGIKPLYLVAEPRRIAFASELAALRATGLVDATPSPEAVLAFLEWGSVPPPLAWNAGAATLEPGTWVEWRQDGRERHGVFADVRDTYVTTSAVLSDERELRAAAAAAVRDSVRAHLVADVPVGVFLSGGIDSCAIVSAAASVGAHKLQTFTVAFDDPTSEADAAAEVARTFDTTHHELRITAADVLQDFPRFLSRMDQPTIDGVNTHVISRAVGETGIKAVLSGLGGDELFGGYPSFRRIPAALRAASAAPAVWRAAAPAVAVALPRRLKPRWRRFAAKPDPAEAYRVQRALFLPEEIAAMAGPALRDYAECAADARVADGRDLLAPDGPESPLASVARMETCRYLRSQLLRDADVMSMAHGLEVRVPFVDHVLASAVWPDLGVHPALVRRKRLLHETLERPLPQAVVSAAKRGFTLPFARWMAGELAPLVRDGLEHLARARLLRPDVPDDVWNRWRRREISWARPWGLAVLGHFVAGGRRA